MRQRHACSPPCTCSPLKVRELEYDFLGKILRSAGTIRPLMGTTLSGSTLYAVDKDSGASLPVAALGAGTKARIERLAAQVLTVLHIATHIFTRQSIKGAAVHVADEGWG